MELNTRFNDTSVELISLSATLDPQNSFESFNNRDICTVAKINLSWIFFTARYLCFRIWAATLQARYEEWSLFSSIYNCWVV